MTLLVAFLLRLSFGLAAGMICVPSRQVPAGYYRVHSYVLLGLNVLAGIVAWQLAPHVSPWPPIGAAVVSYFSSAIWLYERHRPGMLALLAVAGCSLWGMLPLADKGGDLSGLSANYSLMAVTLRYVAPVTSGLVLGTTFAAMFLGHWYLNSPSMQLAPLRRLVLLMGLALALHALVSGCGLGMELSLAEGAGWPVRPVFAILRWLAGFVGTAIMIAMTWQTLKIPNTQAATGMLYVAVITTLLGELSALLMSQETRFPL